MDLDRKPLYTAPAWATGPALLKGNMSESNLEQRVLELENSNAVLNKNLYETTRLLIDVCGELSRVKKDQHQIGENIYNYLENVVDWAEYP